MPGGGAGSLEMPVTPSKEGLEAFEKLKKEGAKPHPE